MGKGRIGINMTSISVSLAIIGSQNGKRVHIRMLIERRQHITGSFRQYEAGSTQTSSIRSKELVTTITTSVTASYLIDLFPFWLLFAHFHFDLIEGSSLLTPPKPIQFSVE